ncbi:MAG: VOC family protein [Candidatus Eremiobacteraeota bacterium]|nr:VOC family protein [Candidatus Eremiobacteraeota bacterium]
MQTDVAVQVRGIDITTYLIKDAERAKKFYTDTMGFKLTMDYGPNGGEFTFGDNTTFGLWKMDDGSWYQCHGAIFAVDDLHKAVEYYKSRGVKIMDHIEDTPACFMAFAEDSEGNNFILHQRKGGRG